MIMRITTLLLIVFFAISLKAQSVEEKIKVIRQHFSEIESVIEKNEYDVVTKEINDPEEGIKGTVTFYFYKAIMKKVVKDYEIYSENHQVYNYYLWDNNLFFVYHISDAPYHGPNMEYEIHHTENRYYFHNLSPIRCLEKYFVISDNTKKSKEQLSNTTPNKEKNCAAAIGVLEEFLEIDL